MTARIHDGNVLPGWNWPPKGEPVNPVSQDDLAFLRSAEAAGDCPPAYGEAMRKAAAEIERLQAEVVKWQIEAGKFGAGCPACDDIGEENERLNARLEQIAIVCTDNMDRYCNHRMALDFVRQIANGRTD